MLSSADVTDHVTAHLSL